MRSLPKRTLDSLHGEFEGLGGQEKLSFGPTENGGSKTLGLCFCVVRSQET